MTAPAGLTPRARIVATGVVAEEPTIMLTGPAPAARKALARAGLTPADIDLFEVNEAFAAVVLKFVRELGVRDGHLRAGRREERHAGPGDRGRVRGAEIHAQVGRSGQHVHLAAEGDIRGNDAVLRQGDLAVQIALGNSHLKGIGFDLAEVGPIFDEYIQTNGLSGRVRFQPGDFFTQDLPRVDVLTMGHILHDWSLEEKKMLISKAFAALPPGGALVVYDALIDDDRSRNAFGLLMSLNMLIETPGGFDYTGADCIGWMKEAGFRDARVEHLVGPDSMVIAFK